MDFGAAMFFTDYSMSATELARALEARGFESMWAPEHSHIPTSRRSPFQGGGDLPKQYYDVMDPFVSLGAAAAVTKTIKLGTGVCLVIQRDTIQTAKLVASLDQVSGGRFLFGIGGGWNAEEMEDHGTDFKTRFKKMREQIEAMKEIWTKDAAEYHGELVDFGADDGVAQAGADSRTRRSSSAAPSRMPRGARCATATAGSPMRAGSNMPTSPISCRSSRQMAAEAGRTIPVTVWGAAEDYDRLRRYQEQGVARLVVSLPPENAEKTLPALDRWAELIRRIGR